MPNAPTHIDLAKWFPAFNEIWAPKIVARYNDRKCAW
jgi:hypothetical protein